MKCYVSNGRIFLFFIRVSHIVISVGLLLMIEYNL